MPGILNEYGKKRRILLPPQVFRESPQDPLGRPLKAVTAVRICSGLRVSAKGGHPGTNPAFGRDLFQGGNTTRQGFCAFQRGFQRRPEVARGSLGPWQEGALACAAGGVRSRR